MTEKPLIRIIDDDASVCDALAYMLRMEGWEVVVFYDASSFLRGDVPSRHGAAILDVRMPGMSGIELQEELIARRYPHPLVFLSGHGDIAMAVSTVKKGAVNFLQKPVNPVELVEVLKECLESDRHSEAARNRATERPYDSFTRRERQVVESLAAGLSNADIADRFGISVRTVEHYRESAYRKVGVNSLDALLKHMGGEHS